MEAGLPFLILSLMSTALLLLWGKNGSGSSRSRWGIACSMIGSLLLCWFLVGKFGVFSAVGGNSLLIGFAITIAAFAVPSFHKKAVLRDIDS